MNAKEIIKILKENGFFEVRQKGSHIVMRKNEKTTVVPMHGKKDVKIGTVKSIEKSTGVKLI